VCVCVCVRERERERERELFICQPKEAMSCLCGGRRRTDFKEMLFIAWGLVFVCVCLSVCVCEHVNAGGALTLTKFCSGLN